jgi:hypothetical protein
MRDHKAYIADIVEAYSRIEEYTREEWERSGRYGVLKTVHCMGSICFCAVYGGEYAQPSPWAGRRIAINGDPS